MINKVKDLIKKLQEFDPESDVFIGENDWYEIQEVKECINEISSTWTQKAVIIN